MARIYNTFLAGGLVMWPLLVLFILTFGCVCKCHTAGVVFSAHYLTKAWMYELPMQVDSGTRRVLS